LLKSFTSTLRQITCRALLLLAVLFAALTTPASAHEYSASFTTIELAKTETVMTFSIDELSVIELAGGDSNQNGQLETEEMKAIQSKLESVISEMVTLKMNNEAQTSSLLGMKQTMKGQVPQIELKLSYPAPSPSQPISLTDTLYETDSKTNYVNLLSVVYGDHTSTAALSGGSRNWSMIVTENDYARFKEKAETPIIDPASASVTDIQSGEKTPSESHANTSGWFSFLKLGMHHILFGFDHLLFLLTLLIVRQSFKQLALVITAFTIAHSITITLTVLGWIQVPSLFVEAVIAISICYVAIENIFRKEIRHRSILTFLFGLIHGMGFAGILLEMNLPKGTLALNLASFNIGIEVIQLAIVALLLPLLSFLHRWKHARIVVMSISGLAFILGAIWLVQRLFF
jgi:hydrogenase/urease accessory protein HupE